MKTTKNKAIESAKAECRTQIGDKRVAAWIVKDDPDNQQVTVTAYSANRRTSPVTRKYVTI